MSNHQGLHAEHLSIYSRRLQYADLTDAYLSKATFMHSETRLVSKIPDLPDECPFAFHPMQTGTELAF